MFSDSNVNASFNRLAVGLLFWYLMLYHVSGSLFVLSVVLAFALPVTHMAIERLTSKIGRLSGVKYLHCLARVIVLPGPL